MNSLKLLALAFSFYFRLKSVIAFRTFFVTVILITFQNCDQIVQSEGFSIKPLSSINEINVVDNSLSESWNTLSDLSAFNGPLRVSSVNRRYFTDNTGKAIFLTGSHTWGNLVDVG